MMATTRRQFLATTAALPLAGVRPAAARPPAATADAVVFILMTGGPSQLDTFDPKPAAPADVRGPFRPISTRTPGVQVSELFPRLAAVSDKWSLIRSMTSDAPPVHEIGMQLVNTGRRFANGVEWPSAGAVLDHLLNEPHELTAWVTAGGEPTAGGGLPTGFESGFPPNGLLYPTRPDAVVRRFPFESGYRVASELVAGRSRFIALNMFPTVFDAPSWDCHADGGCLGTDLGDYRDTVAPLFDRAVSRLIADLHDRGLLERTLVVATGEFGRTPKLNSNGGRDHWTGCWSTLIAGGGVQGGRVVGRSDATAAEPADRPVTPAELVATVSHAVGIPADATIPGPDGEPARVYNAEPVRELF
jgi:hypothetical protein